MGGGAPSPLLRTVKNDVEESYPTKTWGKDVEQRADRLQQEAVRQIGNELVSWCFFSWFFRWRPWNRSKKNWRNQRGAFWKTQVSIWNLSMFLQTFSVFFRSRDLEKSLENEQKKLQEEKKRNEELQKDAKDGVEEPGGPHEDDEKAQNCRCCLIAVMAEGKTLCWRMHEIMKLWNILVRHLWWSYKYHKDSLNISFQVDFGRTLKFLTYLDVFLSGCRGDSLWCCCRMVAAQWAGLPLSTLQHKCCCEKCDILEHFPSHSGRFESFGRWKCRTSGWADGPWSFRTFADFWQHVRCECFWERPDSLVYQLWSRSQQTLAWRSKPCNRSEALFWPNLIATIGGNGWELWQTSNPTKPLRSLRNWGSILQAHFSFVFFRFTSRKKSWRPKRRRKSWKPFCQPPSCRRLRFDLWRKGNVFQDACWAVAPGYEAEGTEGSRKGIKGADETQIADDTVERILMNRGAGIVYSILNIVSHDRIYVIARRAETHERFYMIEVHRYRFAWLARKVPFEKCKHWRKVRGRSAKDQIKLCM